MTRPSRASALIAALALVAPGCAARGAPPTVDIQAALRSAATYSSRLRVSLSSPHLRARTAVILAFRRPDGLRIEIPGPTGARLVAVAAGERLWAVFPADRSVFEGAATAADLEALLGVPLTPSEVMDMLVGVRPPRVRTYDTRWRDGLPRRIDATLPDGGRLKVTVEEAEPGVELPSAAFLEPPHAGYRRIDAKEARKLWGGR